MRHITSIAAALALTVCLGASAATAASGDEYKAKKAECKAKADTMSFGIHKIKKSRWVKDCIAGKNPA
jgi:hypothetical protein